MSSILAITRSYQMDQLTEDQEAEYSSAITVFDKCDDSDQKITAQIPATQVM